MALRCFDVLRPDTTGDLLVVYQSDFLSHLNSRLVIPLLDLERHDVRPVTRLNPIFDVEGKRYVLWSQSAFAARLPELGFAVASLETEHDKIRDAFDFLTTGF